MRASAVCFTLPGSGQAGFFLRLRPTLLGETPCEFILSPWPSLVYWLPLPKTAEKPADPDEELLRQVGLPTDDAGLMKYLRKYAGRDDDLRNMERLVRQLGDQKIAKRDEASGKLSALGLPALPALRKAVKDRDQEIANRSRTCIDEICRKNEWVWIGAAVRRLLKSSPPGTADALLTVLPYAVDEATEETIWFALDGLAERDAKVRPALVPALKDKFPHRRAIAACLLARLGDANQKEAARLLLADPDGTVRLRAAQGFLAARDKSAIPVLIALLMEPATEIAWQAEELLHWAVREDSPKIYVGTGRKKNERKQCRSDWEKWWETRNNGLDLRH